MNLRLKKYKFISIKRDVKLQIDYVSSYNFTVIIITTEIHYIWHRIRIYISPQDLYKFMEILEEIIRVYEAKTLVRF